MSGGHFDCSHNTISDIAENVSSWIKEHGDEISDETRAILMEAERLFRISSIYLHRVDWFLCGDDGEDTFRTRLREDLENL